MRPQLSSRILAMTPWPLVTTSGGAAEWREARDSLDPSVLTDSLEPVEPMEPRLPVTSRVPGPSWGSSHGGRFPFHTREANQEQK